MNGRRLITEARGETWDYVKLSAHCGITEGTAKSRIRLHLRGCMSDDALLFIGNGKCGGDYTTRCKCTDEWRKLGRRKAKDIQYRGGTWERRFIPDRLGAGSKGVGRPRNIESPDVVYSPGQFRVNL